MQTSFFFIHTKAFLIRSSALFLFFGPFGVSTSCCGTMEPVSRCALLNQIDTFIESLIARRAQVTLAVGLCRTAGAVTCRMDKPRCSAASL